MKRKVMIGITICVVLVGILAVWHIRNIYFSYKNALEEMGIPDITYTCGDDSVLTSYYEKSEKDFQKICKCLEWKGYENYYTSMKNGSRFATYVQNKSMMHIYWLKDRTELTIVSSETEGASLPPQTPELADAAYDITVTQLRDEIHNNGMGYVVRLADGSFIIYDGAYVSQSDVLYKTLCDLNGGEEGIRIAAWLITHDHDDHSECFPDFTYKYSELVKLDFVLAAPMKEWNSSHWYKKLGRFTEMYQDAKLVTVHTGMEFTFGNLKMEILLSPYDLFKHEFVSNFNATSVVSRLYSEDGSFLVLGDATVESGEFLLNVYDSYLESDMCQVSHHGVEDMPFEVYDVVKAPILFYPCDQALYDLTNRAAEVRKALREADYTKEILIAGNGQYTRLLKRKEAEISTDEKNIDIYKEE